MPNRCWLYEFTREYALNRIWGTSVNSLLHAEHVLSCAFLYWKIPQRVIVTGIYSPQKLLKMILGILFFISHMVKWKICCCCSFIASSHRDPGIQLRFENSTAVLVPQCHYAHMKSFDIKTDVQLWELLVTLTPTQHKHSWLLDVVIITRPHNNFKSYLHVCMLNVLMQWVPILQQLNSNSFISFLFSSNPSRHTYIP